MLKRTDLSFSSFLIALMIRRPPALRFFSDSTTGFHAGVVSIIAANFSGDSSSVLPAQSAPSDNANACSSLFLAKTKTLEDGNLYFTSFNTR